MKPILDPKNPFKVNKDQLAALDAKIKEIFPNAVLSEGCKYARWADVSTFSLKDACLKLDSFGDEFKVDGYFEGKICGQNKLIFFWLPFFS